MGPAGPQATYVFPSGTAWPVGTSFSAEKNPLMEKKKKNSLKLQIAVIMLHPFYLESAMQAENELCSTVVEKNSES